MMRRIDNDEQVQLEAVGQGGDAEVLATVAARAAGLHEVDIAGGETTRRLLIGIGTDGGHQVLDETIVENLDAVPPSRRGDVRVATPEALITYAGRHLDPHATTLWAEIDHGRLTVILNDHGDLEGEPGWGDHQVALAMTRSPEWVAWTKLAGQWVGQTELAEFLEEHLLEVSHPDGSTLLEVAQTFHATTNATFKSSQQLHSGEQRLVYEEDVQASAGRSQHTEIPTDLTLTLRPWLGVDPVAVQSKFRFRVRSGELALGVKLLYADEVSRTAVEEAAIEVGEQLGLEVIEGVPPVPRR